MWKTLFDNLYRPMYTW